MDILADTLNPGSSHPNTHPEIDRMKGLNDPRVKAQTTVMAANIGAGQPILRQFSREHRVVQIESHAGSLACFQCTLSINAHSVSMCTRIVACASGSPSKPSDRWPMGEVSGASSPIFSNVKQVSVLAQQLPRRLGQADGAQ